MCIKCELLDLINKTKKSTDPKSTLPNENYPILELADESRKIREESMKDPFISFIHE